MKLELKHLAAYLPYGLKIYDGEYSRELTIYITTYNTDSVGISRLFILQNNYDYSLGLPILRSLSDLTKEIEVNGGVITPIVELAKIADNSFKNEISVKSKYEIYGCKYIDNEETINVFAYHIEDSCFGLHSEFNHEKHFSVSPNQLMCFEFLFKHHFDVFGLIENNLAININTLVK